MVREGVIAVLFGSFTTFFGLVFGGPDGFVLSSSELLIVFFLILFLGLTVSTVVISSIFVVSIVVGLTSDSGFLITFLVVIVSMVFFSSEGVSLAALLAAFLTATSAACFAIAAREIVVGGVSHVFEASFSTDFIGDLGLVSVFSVLTGAFNGDFGRAGTSSFFDSLGFFKGDFGLVVTSFSVLTAVFNGDFGLLVTSSLSALTVVFEVDALV